MLLRLAFFLTLDLLFALPAGANHIVFATNCCYGGSSVSVLSTATNEEIAGVAVQTYAIAVAISPDGKRAYAVNAGSNTISIINTATHRNIGTIAMTNSPMNVIVSPDSQSLYVTVCTASNPITGCVRGAVDAISIATGMTVAAIQLDSVPNDLKFTPDGTLLVVAASPALVEIDPATNTIVRKIHAGKAAPQWVAITPDSKTAYTTGSGIWSFDLQTGGMKMRSTANYVFLAISPDAKFLDALSLNVLDTISTTTFGVVGSVNTTQYSTALVLSPDGRRAYIPDVVTSSVVVADVIHERVIAHAPVAYLPAGMAITPNGREVYVTNSDSSTISALDGTTNRLIGQAEAGARPKTVAVMPDGSRVYVANWLGDTVSVIDGHTINKIEDIDVGYAPYDAIISPDGRRCYLNMNGEGVKFIDTATNRVVASLHYGPQGVSGALSALAVSPDGNWLYALDAQQGFAGVRIIDTHTAKLAGRFTVSPIDGLSEMTMKPDGSTLYVTAYFQKAIDVIDVGTRKVTEKIPMPASPEYAIASPDGKRLYVVIGTNTVGALDLRTEKFVATVNVPVQYGIGGLAVSHDGRRVYVTGSSVFAIDTATMKIVHQTNVGAVTWGVSVSR